MSTPAVDVAAQARYQALSEALAARLDSRFPSRLVAVGQGVDGSAVNVEVRELGAGPKAIVLLHGIGSGSGSWMDVALALADEFPGLRIVAWDAPGYARSTPLEPRKPVGSDYAERLKALLQALGVESALLVGHSLGAFTTCAAARALGADVIERIVLISPAGGYGAPGQEEVQAKTYAQRMGNLDAQGVEGMARANGGPNARMLSGSASDEARAWVRWNMARLNDAGYRQAVEMLCGDWLGRYAPVAMPAEVHVGDQDIVTPPSACQAVAEAYGASFDTIAGPGHASPIERPAEVAALIARAARSAFPSLK